MGHLGGMVLKWSQEATEELGPTHMCDKQNYELCKRTKLQIPQGLSLSTCNSLQQEIVFSDRLTN